jgi:glycogen operon protein
MLDDDFLILVNAWWEPLRFTVPATRSSQVWFPEIDTFAPGSLAPADKVSTADQVEVGPRSVVVLRGPRII